VLLFFQRLGTQAMEVTFDDCREDFFVRHRANAILNLANDLPQAEEIRLVRPPPLPCQPADMNYDTTR
jgi:hypothetical protein